MKPVCQIYSLIVEDLEGFNKPKNYYDEKFKMLLKKQSFVKARDKINKLKNEEVEKLLFSEALRKANNQKNKVREITDFFRVNKK